MPQSTPPPSHDAPSASPRVDALLSLAPAVYRTARRLTRGREDAAAVALEALRSLHSQASGSTGEPSRSAVFGALWRTLGQLWQQQGHVPRDPSPTTAEQIFTERLRSDDHELDRLLIARLDASPDVDVALRQLSERERFVALMIDVEDCSRDEAAQALGCEVAVVSGLLLGARARMFASLLDYADRGGERDRTG